MMKETAMDDKTARPEYVGVEGGRIAYEVIGHGPLVVLSPGIGDTRSTYRFLAPMIANAGYRVASVDLRGHGDSSTGWDSYSRTDTASDLIEVIRKLGGPAVIVGQSFSGGSATIAAATNPDLLSAIVEIAPATRPLSISVGGLLRNAHHRRAVVLLVRFLLGGRIKTWLKYLDVAYPVRKPADWDTWLPALQANLSETGRIKATQKMAGSNVADAAAQLTNVRCPALVVMGRNDPDWPDPEAEAAAIVGLLPAGLGRYEMIENAGHYPHAQYPQQVADAVLPFLAGHTHA
jgi:pimeloyl-ACP methyl ester carboxylesterase